MPDGDVGGAAALPAAPRPLRIGVKASSEQFGPTELVRIAVRAEELGFDSVFLSDHVQPWRERGGHAPAALPVLAFAAARTSGVLLGTSVLTPTYRYHPAVIAQEVATLSLLAPGRVLLGVGTGEALNEQVVGSLPGGAWPPFKERFARLREAVALMRRLWAGERVTAEEGSVWPVAGLRLYDVPQVPPELYVAAGGPMVARYAGRHGDGLIATSGKGRALYADELLPAVAEGLAELAQKRTGAEPTAYGRMLELKVSYDRDPARALENCRFWAPLSLPAEAKHSLGDPAAMEAAADALPIEDVAPRWIVASEPGQVVAAAAEYVEMGFDHLVLHGPGEDQEAFLTAVAADVLPGLRALRG